MAHAKQLLHTQHRGCGDMSVHDLFRRYWLQHACLWQKQCRGKGIGIDFRRVFLHTRRATDMWFRFFVIIEMEKLVANGEVLATAWIVAVVAVLQFQNRLYDSQKLTLYLYINIEVFLGYGNSFKRTATLQHCNSFCQYIQEWKKYRRKMKNFLWSIREPQSLFLTFAVSNWNSGQAVFKGKNCED